MKIANEQYPWRIYDGPQYELPNEEVAQICDQTQRDWKRLTAIAAADPDPVYRRLVDFVIVGPCARELPLLSDPIYSNIVDLEKIAAFCERKKIAPDFETLVQALLEAHVVLYRHVIARREALYAAPVHV